MRNISSNGLAKLTTKYGIEPVTVVEIDFYVKSNGQPATLSYADRDIPATADSAFIPGRIVEVGALDDVADLSNSSSAQLELTLDDTDGSIKKIYDAHDFHKQSVRVYQWFQGLDLSDKFLVFAGKINTPVSWGERDRTVKITVLSHLEDVEVGFSPEAGEFAWLPSAMAGKAWPSIFGTVQDCPATQITKICQAVTITPVGIPSGSDAYLAAPLYANGTNSDSQAAVSQLQTMAQMNLLMAAAECWYELAPAGMQDMAKSQSLLDQWSRLNTQLINQKRKIAAKEQCITLSRHDAVDYVQTNGIGPNPIQTLGGEDFPQRTPIWVNIGGGSFYGHFEGNLFYVSERVNLDDAVQLATDLYTFQEGQCNASQTGGPTVTTYKYTQQVPIGSQCDGSINGSAGWASNEFDQHPLGPGEMSVEGTIISPANKANVFLGGLGFGQLPAASSWLRIFWKEGGQTVTLETAEPVSYVASIVPGRVICVRAFKQYDGPHVLTTVPTDFYKVSTQTFGSITAVIITLNRQLSTYRYSDGTNQGWSNELYVTFESSVGPNTVDVMRYLIDTYSDLTWDTSTFNYVHDKLIPFPSNFALLETKNLIDVLKDIAFQCRCRFGWRTMCSI